MIETLLSLDEQVFRWVNSGLSHPALDVCCTLFRAKIFWAPLYLWVISFLLLNDEKRGAYIVLGLLLTVAVADTVSSRGIKKMVQRERPCHNAALQHEIKLRVSCGSGYSFTSSHATNHFAAAVFLMGVWGQMRLHRWKRGWLVWAAAVSFSQVYVGVHYPADILAGALLGAVIGKLCFRWFQWWQVGAGRGSQSPNA